LNYKELSLKKSIEEIKTNKKYKKDYEIKINDLKNSIKIKENEM
jgi:hypothetical protein